MNEVDDSKTPTDISTRELAADDVESDVRSGGIRGGPSTSTAVAPVSRDIVGERTIKSSVESTENPSSACGGVM